MDKLEKICGDRSSAPNNLFLSIFHYLPNQGHISHDYTKIMYHHKSSKTFGGYLENFDGK